MSKELNEACQANNKTKVLQLLQSPAVVHRINGRINDKWWQSLTALCCASESASADVVEALMRKGAKINVWSGSDGWELLPIHAACESSIDAVKKCELLLGETNRNINHPSGSKRYDQLPISIAANKGNIEVVDLLLRRGADYDIHEHYRGHGPLQAAAANGHVKVIELLLQHDPRIINTQSQYISWGYGWSSVGTALHVAALRGQVAAVKALVAHPDCDVTVTDSRGKTALELATEWKKKKIIEILSNPEKHICKAARQTIPARYQGSSPVQGGAKSNAKSTRAESSIKANILEHDITTLRFQLENVSVQADDRDKAQSKRIHDLESRVKLLEDRSHSQFLRDKDFKEIKDELKRISKEIESLKSSSKSSMQTKAGVSNQLTDLTLDEIAMQIGVDDQMSLGINLGFSFEDVRRTVTEFSTKKDATLALLIRWRNQERSGNREQQVKTLKKIFEKLDKMNLVYFLKDK